jgi:glycosyltransferase involved in cell wall biosynthesis
VTPEVSLVMTAWNAERHIAEALQSALDQTRPPDEIIVVDDGSTDETGEVAAGFAGVTVVRQDNQGVGAGRNTGIAAAHGALLAFLDADDLWLPHKLERQRDVLEAEPTVGAVFCLVDEFLDLPEGAPATAVRAPHLGVAAPLSSCALLPRPVVESLGPLPTTLVGEWVGWWSQARAQGVTEHIVPEVLVRRRIHGSNNSLRREPDEAIFLKIARAHRRASRRP